MLHIITDAPTFVARELVTFARGVTAESCGWDGQDTPTWASTIISGNETSDLYHVMQAVKAGGYKAAAWAPRERERGVAYANPVFALAAARVDRTREGGSSAPANRW